MNTDYFQWIMALFLLFLLLFFENRAYEVSHRLNFKVFFNDVRTLQYIQANIIAKLKRQRVKEQRDFAKTLLNNVIPEHVISCVRDRVSKSLIEKCNKLATRNTIRKIIKWLVFSSHLFQISRKCMKSSSTQGPSLSGKKKVNTFFNKF